MSVATPRGTYRDLTGQTFGRATVLRDTGERTSHRVVVWECRCSCGETFKTITGSLTSGRVSSCGCLRRETAAERGHLNRGSDGPLRHGHARRGQQTAEYITFKNAKERCTNTSRAQWDDYGGRGIEFRFETFEEFLAEVGPKPSPEYSIDRIDNDGHYERGNVRWATRREQNLNQRRRST